MQQIATTIEQSLKLIELGMDPKTSDMHWSIFGHNGGYKIFDDDKQLCFGRDVYTDDIDICDEELPAWTPQALLKYIKKYNRNVSFRLEWPFEEYVLSLKFYDSTTVIKKTDLFETLIEGIVWLANGKKLEPEK